MRKVVKWSVADLVDIIKKRQLNEFDANFVVSGSRGDGKSTLIAKILYRIKNFNPWKHQVYSRNDVVKLLQTQTYGVCWDDEAINSGYKRNFNDRGQQELIKILTAYRDNYNVYASAIPSFFSLDKDLRELYFIHLHVVERGIAVVHMPLQGRLYSQDRWDTKYNAKIEDSWSKRMLKDATFKPPYHKLSTFRGYLFFTDITPKQRKLYKQIKKEKRAIAFKTDADKNKELTFHEKVYNLLLKGKISRDGLLQMCLMEGKKYSNVRTALGGMLRDNGSDKKVDDYIVKEGKEKQIAEVNKEIENILPDL